MKTAIGAVVASAVSSTCCLGPVVLTGIGADTLVAAARSFHTFRRFFLGLSAVMLGAAFFTTYRPASGDRGVAAGSCAPAARRRTKTLLWIATVLALVFATFPYYGM